jgi:hypothetical protein
MVEVWCEWRMVLAAASVIAVLLSAPLSGKSAKSEGPKFEQGQKLFNQGEFDAALKVLDAAAAESGEAALQEKVQLLRAQCWFARQDFVRAEEAFVLALDANPDTSLDPSRVDPTVVKLLESVRARLTGSVAVNSTPPGASLLVDGKANGTAPQTVALPPGKHVLEVRWGNEGPFQRLEIQVRPRRELRVEWVQGTEVTTESPQAPSSLLSPRPIRPFGDLRGMFEPATSGFVSGGLELGGGFEFSYFRVGLFARVFPIFGVTPRFQFALPVMDKASVILEAGLPLTFFLQAVGLGFQGGGGAEYYPLEWLGVYVLIGGRHNFLPASGGDRTAFTATGGVRLRVP